MRKIFFLIISSVLLFCSCVKEIEVTKVSLDSKSMVMVIGETEKLVATVSPYNADNQILVWSSSNSSIVKVVDGAVTAVGVGTADVIVSADDGIFNDRCTVTVVEKDIYVDGISFEPESIPVQMLKGESSQLKVLISPDDATCQDVKWTSSNPACVSVDANGNLTALSAGKAAIIATTVDGGFTVSCEITVIEAVASISINPDKAELFEKENLVLTASIEPETASDTRVTWTSSDESVATVSAGVVTALRAGTAVITATTCDGGLTATCTLTVRCKVSGVRLDYPELNLEENGTATLTATVYPERADNKAVTWIIDDPSIASVDNGVVKALKAGTAVISVQTEDGQFKDECMLTVVSRVSSLTISQAAADLFVNETLTLSAAVEPANASNKSVVWSSSDESVATVTSDGKVKALKVGEASICATSEDGGLHASCLVSVFDHVRSIELDNAELILTEGESATLKATVKPSTARDLSVSWSSSDTSVATVGADGTVHALKPGTATISAISNEDKSIKQTCRLTVKAKVIPVQSVTLSVHSLTMDVNTSSTLVADVLPADATNKAVTWKSSAPTIVSVDANGAIQARKAGTATVTASSSNGKSDSCVVTVTAQSAVTSVTLSRTYLSIVANESFQLKATVKPDEVAAETELVWTSSKPDVATVDSDGYVTGVSMGSTEIIATAKGTEVSGRCVVTVAATVIKVTGVSISQTSATLEVGKTLTLTETVLPESADDKSVTWTSSNPGCATVSANGVVTGVSSGTAVITVTTTDGKYKANCEVKVVAELVAVTGLTLDQNHIDLYVNDKMQLTATVRPSNATNKDLIWTATGNCIVDANGLVTAIRPGEGGTIMVKTVDGGYQKFCSVTVMTRHVESISLNSTKISMKEGDTYRLVATVLPDNATDKTVVWSSSDTAVVKVSQDGVITAVKPGDNPVTITARTVDKSLTATCQVKVTSAEVGGGGSEGATFDDWN